MAQTEKYLSLVAMLVALSAFGGSQELSDEMKEMNKRVSTQQNWSSRASSPGAALIAREKVHMNGVVVYDLYAKGVPAELTYELYGLGLTPSDADQMNKQMGDVRIGQDNQLMDGPNDPRVLVIPTRAPGQVFRELLVSKDQRYRAFLSIVPEPIEGKDKGCRISVVRLAPKFELAFIQGEGFLPNEEIEFQSKSYGETRNGKLKVDADGYAEAGIMPFVKGKTKGTTELQIVSSQCSPKLTFRWGMLTK